MSKLWRIKPLDKKSIEYFIDVYEIKPDGSARGWSATFRYRWGLAFRDEDNPPSQWEADREIFHANANIGWGCEFEDLVSVDLEFDDDFAQEEKDQIQSLCTGNIQDEEGRWGESWIFDGEHNWQIEEDVVNVYSPFVIDLVDPNQYNVVIESPAKLEE